MKSIVAVINKICGLSFTLLVLVFVIILNMKHALAQPKSETPSIEIIYNEALKPGSCNLNIPFDSLDGSLTIKGIVSDSGSFTLNEIIPRQTIIYNPEKENFVQFFVNNNENPSRFIIKVVNTKSPVSIELLAQDTMSLIKTVIFTDEQAIYAIHNNIDPNEATADEELALWETSIEIDSTDVQNGNLKFNVTFNRNETFADTIYLPFNQVFLDMESVRGAYISVKIKPERIIKYANYYNFQSNDFIIRDDSIGSHLEFNFVINDIYNKNYDQILWSIVEIRKERVYPLKMLHALPPDFSLYYEYDKYRTQMPGTNKKIPDSTFFKTDLFSQNSAIRLTGSQNDTLQIRTYSSSKGNFYIRNNTNFVNDMEYLAFNVFNDNDSIGLKNNLYKYRYYINGNDQGSVLLDSIPIYRDYYGFDFFINSSDSLSIIPTDAIYMSKLNFWSTNYYDTAEPWRYKDTVAPKIISTSPSDKDSNVSVNTDIKIKFDEEVNRDLINSNNIKVNYHGYLDTVSEVQGSFHYIDSTIIFKPQFPLWFETEHYVYVKNITDLAGNKIEDYEFSFTTEIDTTIDVSETYVQNYSMQVFPNPIIDDITIVLTGNFSEGVLLKIYDVFGKIKFVLNIKTYTEAEQEFKIKVNELPSGLYLIREENSGLIQKFMKQ